MSVEQFVVDFFIVVTVIVVAIKCLLPKANLIDVFSLVYNVAIFSIIIADVLGFIKIPFLLIGYLIIMLGIGAGLTMFRFLKVWDSRKK